MKLESLSQIFLQIPLITTAYKKLVLIQQLRILLVIKEWDYGHTIIQIVHKARRGIINYHNIFQVTLLKNLQILDQIVNVTFYTVFPIKGSLDYFSAWVQQVYDLRCVILSCPGEDCYIIILADIYQEPNHMRPEVNKNSQYLPRTNFDSYHSIMRLRRWKNFIRGLA